MTHLEPPVIITKKRVMTRNTKRFINIVFVTTAAASFMTITAEAATNGGRMMMGRGRGVGNATSTFVGRPRSSASKSNDELGPGVTGTITAINNATITLSGKNRALRHGELMTFAVDASNASIKKITAPTTTGTPPTETTITLANLLIGNNIYVRGSVSGTVVTATDIIVREGNFGMMGGRFIFNSDRASTTQRMHERKFNTSTRPMMNYFATTTAFHPKGWTKITGSMKNFYNKILHGK